MTKELVKKLLPAWIAFFLLAVLYFVPVHLPHKIFLPVALLALYSFGMMSWEMCTALAFSAIGDFMGSCSAELGPEVALLGQIGGFAVAQLLMAVYLLKRGWKHKAATKPSKKDKKAKVNNHGMYFAVAITLVVVLAYVVVDKIIPHVAKGPVMYGVMVYMCLICLMLFSALMQRDWLWGIGACLFVFSDFTLAWNLFVEPVPASKYLIMITYYLAQVTLFTCAARDKVPEKKASSEE